MLRSNLLILMLRRKGIGLKCRLAMPVWGKLGMGSLLIEILN